MGWWLMRLGHTQSATIPPAAATADGASSMGSGMRRGLASTVPAPAVMSSVIVWLPPRSSGPSTSLFFTLRSRGADLLHYPPAGPLAIVHSTYYDLALYGRRQRGP